MVYSTNDCDDLDVQSINKCINCDDLDIQLIDEYIHTDNASKFEKLMISAHSLLDYQVFMLAEKIMQNKCVSIALLYADRLNEGFSDWYFTNDTMNKFANYCIDVVLNDLRNRTDLLYTDFMVKYSDYDKLIPILLDGDIFKLYKLLLDIVDHKISNHIDHIFHNFYDVKGRINIYANIYDPYRYIFANYILLPQYIEATLEKIRCIEELQYIYQDNLNLEWLNHYIGSDYKSYCCVMKTFYNFLLSTNSKYLFSNVTIGIFNRSMSIMYRDNQFEFIDDILNLVSYSTEYLIPIILAIMRMKLSKFINKYLDMFEEYDDQPDDFIIALLLCFDWDYLHEYYKDCQLKINSMDKFIKHLEYIKYYNGRRINTNAYKLFDLTSFDIEWLANDFVYIFTKNKLSSNYEYIIDYIMENIKHPSEFINGIMLSYDHSKYTNNDKVLIYILDKYAYCLDMTTTNHTLIYKMSHITPEIFKWFYSNQYNFITSDFIKSMNNGDNIKILALIDSLLNTNIHLQEYIDGYKETLTEYQLFSLQTLIFNNPLYTI